MDCLFCKIINGSIPSYTIYEDDIVKVFLDIKPSSRGHMLVVPKKHYLDIEDIDEDVLRHINEVTKSMYKLLKDKLKADGLTIIQNNGYGQEIKHYHVHLTPRYKDDQIRYTYPKDKIDVKNIYEILKK